MAYISKVTAGGSTYNVGSNLYGTCDTAAGTAAKVAVVSGFDTLETGVTVHIKFTYSNTVASPTLAIKPTSSGTATTAKSIMRYGTTAPSTSAKTSWQAGSVVSFTYDGTYWQMNGWLNDDSDTNNAVTQTATTTNANYEVLFSNTADNTTRTEGARKSSGFIFNPSNNSVLIGSLQTDTTLGYNATAFGTNIEASGNYSHAEGSSTTASGNYSHAEGSSTTANGYCSHAEGSSTTASGNGSHAEGSSTTASDYYSHAEGNNTTASGSYSHAEGSNTTANHRSQHVFGEYNIADNSSADSTARGNYIEIVGNGTSDTSSNARTLDWSGNEWIAGNETIAGKLTLSGSSSDITFTGTHKWDGINASLNTTLGAKLNKSGGEITGTVYSQTNGANFEVYNPALTHKMRFTATDTPRSGLYDMIASKWAFWKNQDGEYQIGPNGYAVQARTQAKGTTKYPLRDGVVFAYRTGASSNTVTVACVSQWDGDGVIYQHHVSSINVAVDTWHETIKVTNNYTGNIQVIMIGQFNDNSTY